MTSDNAVCSSRVSGVARLLRGWVVAIVAVLLAAGGHQIAHSMMHGTADMLPFELLGFAAAITAPIAVGLVGKRHSTRSTAITTVVAQLVFHALYALPYTGVPSVHDVHAHHESAGLAVTTHASATADMVMVAAHIFAAVFTTAVIVHGERCIFALVGWVLLAPTRLVLATEPASIAHPKRVPSLAWVWTPQSVDVSQACSTRGPPVIA
ncbi:MAG TPA: hypothetical protein H9822_02135 [Candidatus Yaniella excrementavium]|nr:hypothetical protein [Candidatus Yaniella excrementavium]